MKIRMLAVLIFFGFALFAGEANFSAPNDVVMFDLWKYFESEKITDIGERADALYWLTSLQGIVNRDAPRLYLFASLALFDIETKAYYTKEYVKLPVTELDEFWFDHFTDKGYFAGVKINRVQSLVELFSQFEAQVNGAVLWDMKVPATSNVALMAAGCEKLLPVSADLAGGRFRRRLSEQLPELKIKLDLTTLFDGKKPVTVNGQSYPSSGSAKNDCYKYIIEKYLRTGLANPYKMWFNCDASMWGRFRSFYGGVPYKHLGDRNELQQNGMYNADYWVAQRAVIFDLCPWGDHTPADDPTQPLGTDCRSWHDILEVSYSLRRGVFGVAGGFVPWWLKYTAHTGEKHEPVPTEWEFVSLLTSYNMGNDGDAAFGLANASFFQHLPAVSREEAEFKEPAPVEYDSNATYIAILMLDYDGSAWLNQMVTSVYNDPDRGKMPLNWCINPVLNERVPHAVKYIYEKRTANDFLGFSGDGACYIQPMSLSERNGRIRESGIPYYENYAGALNERYGVKYNVFYIDDTFDLKWAEMAARITPGGFGFNCHIQEQLINGTPVNFVRHFHVSQREPLRNHLEGLYKESLSSRRDQARFEALRCILMPPGMIYGIKSELDGKYPKANVRFIDVPNFYRLLKLKLGS